jgi:hypothetical protein
MAMERRSSYRYNLHVQSRVTRASDGKPVGNDNILSQDISSRGAFFLTWDCPPVGTQVLIKILLPVSKLRDGSECDACLICQGVVVRKNETGMAVHFTNSCKILPMGK